MTSKQPPRVASWMLKQFGSGPDNEAVLGDLAEQYLQKDSTLWYWRQAMKAIPVSFFREIRAHKRIAARALLAGWGMWALYVTWVLPYITPFFFGGSFGVSIQPRDPAGTAWTLLSAPVGVQAAMNQPFSFVFAVALPFVVWAICGWLVARFHRDQQTGVVLLLAGSILFLDLLFFGRFAFQVRPPTAWLYAFAGHLAANIAASVAGILAGGLMFRETPKTARD